METFKNFELNNADFIFGGELEPTYVGANGDFYDPATKRYIFLLE